MLNFNACFSFQYRAEKLYTNYVGALLLFIVDGDKRMMPVWSMNVDSLKYWTSIVVKLNFKAGFTKVCNTIRKVQVKKAPSSQVKMA